MALTGADLDLLLNCLLEFPGYPKLRFGTNLGKLGEKVAHAYPYVMLTSSGEPPRWCGGDGDDSGATCPPSLTAVIEICVGKQVPTASITRALQARDDTAASGRTPTLFPYSRRQRSLAEPELQLAWRERVLRTHPFNGKNC